MPVRLQLIRMESAEMLRRQREARRKPALGGPNAGVIADRGLVKSAYERRNVLNSIETPPFAFLGRRRLRGGRLGPGRSTHRD